MAGLHSTSAEPTHPSHLLTLPLELRFMILELLLVKSGTLSRRYGTRPSSASDFTMILLVCKQLHHEGCGIFYRKNVFRLLLGSPQHNFSWPDEQLDQSIIKRYGQLLRRIATSPIRLEEVHAEDALGNLSATVQLIFSKIAKWPQIEILRIDVHSRAVTSMRLLVEVFGEQEMKSKLAAWMISRAEVPKHLRICLTRHTGRKAQLTKPSRQTWFRCG